MLKSTASKSSYKDWISGNSFLDPETLSDFKKAYSIPSSYTLRLPLVGERSNPPPPNPSGVNTLVFWLAHLEVGLHVSAPKYL